MPAHDAVIPAHDAVIPAHDAVVPAQAGIQGTMGYNPIHLWIPACAGMTGVGAPE